jgi:hypothetical protein
VKRAAVMIMNEYLGDVWLAREAMVDEARLAISMLQESRALARRSHHPNIGQSWMRERMSDTGSSLCSEDCNLLCGIVKCPAHPPRDLCTCRRRARVMR